MTSLKLFELVAGRRNFNFIIYNSSNNNCSNIYIVNNSLYLSYFAVSILILINRGVFIESFLLQSVLRNVFTYIYVFSQGLLRGNKFATIDVWRIT